MNAQSSAEINISRLSFLCWMVRGGHWAVFMFGTSVIPTTIGLLIWRLGQGQSLNHIHIACAALGPWLLVYSFNRLSSLRRTPPWQLVALSIASIVALGYAYIDYRQMPSSERELPSIIYSYWFLAMAAVVLPVQSVLQWRFQESTLEDLGTIGSLIKTPPGLGKNAKSISFPKGCLFAGLGVLFLALQTFGETFAAVRERDTNSTLFFFVGLALILRSRRYLQTDADSLLAIDRRPPILFLRSFTDDAKGGWRLMLTGFRLLDYSLELRLAKYFMHFGPFIAVGTPNQTTPQIGAARKLFAEGEWQDAVIDWAKSAQLVSIFVGSTKWVNWEISQVVSLDLTERLILLMPESRLWLPWKHKAAMKQRLSMLEQAMAGTPWYDALSQIAGAGTIRAILLEKDGSIFVISSGLRNRDSYHLATVIAHRLITKRK